MKHKPPTLKEPHWKTTLFERELATYEMQNEGFQLQFLTGGQTFLCLTVQEYAIMLATDSSL